LKKVKKNWSHELKRASSDYYENIRCQHTWWTYNHWHGRLETYPLRYQVDTIEWQTDRFIRNMSCEAVRWN